MKDGVESAPFNSVAQLSYNRLVSQKKPSNHTIKLSHNWLTKSGYLV